MTAVGRPEQWVGAAATREQGQMFSAYAVTGCQMPKRLKQTPHVTQAQHAVHVLLLFPQSDSAAEIDRKQMRPMGYKLPGLAVLCSTHLHMSQLEQNSTAHWPGK